MSQLGIWAVIAAVAAGGFVLRAAFLALPVFRGEIPERTRTVLGLVPAAAFAALVAPAVLLGDEGTLDLVSPASLASVVAVVVALRWRNLALTMAVGLAAFVVVGLML